jgi:hypothetical protein
MANDMPWSKGYDGVRIGQHMRMGRSEDIAHDVDEEDEEMRSEDDYASQNSDFKCSNTVPRNTNIDFAPREEGIEYTLSSGAPAREDTSRAALPISTDVTIVVSKAPQNEKGKNGCNFQIFLLYPGVL